VRQSQMGLKERMQDTGTADLFTWMLQGCQSCATGGNPPGGTLRPSDHLGNSLRKKGVLATEKIGLKRGTRHLGINVQKVFSGTGKEKRT